MGKKKSWSSYGSEWKFESYDNAGSKYSNRVPGWRLKKAFGVSLTNSSYGCGFNAFNMCLAMWDYKERMPFSNYRYWYVGDHRFGATCDLYMNMVKKYFKFYKYSFNNEHRLTGSILWNVFTFGIASAVREAPFSFSIAENNDYTNYAVIALLASGEYLHYVIIIGKSKCGDYYFVTDHNRKIYNIHRSTLRELCHLEWFGKLARVPWYQFVAVG